MGFSNIFNVVTINGLIIINPYYYYDNRIFVIYNII